MSLVVVCPPLPALGAVLGLFAYRRADDRRGRSLAAAAIVLGAIVTGLWAAGAAWWHGNVRAPLLAGPHRALLAAGAQDTRGFAAALAGEHDPVDVKRFVVAVAADLGPLRRIAPDPLDAAPVGPVMVQGRVPVHYRAAFADREVEVVGRFVLWDGGPVLAFDAILIRDEDGRVLAYPAGAAEDGRWPAGFLGERWSLRETR